MRLIGVEVYEMLSDAFLRGCVESVAHELLKGRQLTYEDVLALCGVSGKNRLYSEWLQRKNANR